MTARTWISRAMASCLLALSLPAWAVEGGLAIEVIDAETRRPLSGVTLRVESRDGASSSLVTDETGAARFEALENGFYELRATADGRQPVVEPEVRVIEDQIRPLRIELTAADAAIDEVVVTGRARRADVFGGVSSSFFSRDELRNAVGSGSDVMRALDGLPGVASTGDFANFTVRGRGPRNNLIFVDGFPLDKVVHFDQSLGEGAGIGKK